GLVKAGVTISSSGRGMRFRRPNTPSASTSVICEIPPPWVAPPPSQRTGGLPIGSRNPRQDPHPVFGLDGGVGPALSSHAARCGFIVRAPTGDRVPCFLPSLKFSNVVGLQLAP